MNYCQGIICESKVLNVSGLSYGAEFFLRKQKGLLTGWVSYTLSKTERTVPGINNNKSYPLRCDRRHAGNMVLSYQFSSSINMGANWTYATGGAITMPVGHYEYNDKTYPVYSERNGYRLPDYHRLDLSATYEKPKNEFKKYTSSWTLRVGVAPFLFILQMEPLRGSLPLLTSYQFQNLILFRASTQ